MVEMMLAFSRPLQSRRKELLIVMGLKQSKQIVFSLKKQSESPAYWRGRSWLAATRDPGGLGGSGSGETSASGAAGQLVASLRRVGMGSRASPSSGASHCQLQFHR